MLGVVVAGGLAVVGIVLPPPLVTVDCGLVGPVDGVVAPPGEVAVPVCEAGVAPPAPVEVLALAPVGPLAPLDPVLVTVVCLGAAAPGCA
jgi:hypothetical protein